MHNTWQMLSWMWAAVFIVYCLLTMVASWKLQGREKARNRNVLIVMVALYAIRIVIKQVYGGQVYRFAVVFVGIAAAIAVVIVAKMLIMHTPSDDGAVGGEDGMRSLKLN